MAAAIMEILTLVCEHSLVTGGNGGDCSSCIGTQRRHKRLWSSRLIQLASSSILNLAFATGCIFKTVMLSV